MLPAVNIIECCMLYLLLILRSVGGAAAGAVQLTTCKTDTVEEGNTGSMEFSFSSEIDFTKNVLLHLQKFKTDKETGPDLLICDGMDERPNQSLPCTSNNSHFTTKGLIGHTLTVLIPNATRELHGEYVLKAFLGGDSNETRCNFTVVKNEGLASGDPAGMKSDKVKTIVAPVVALVLLIVIVAAVVGFLLVRRRRRNKDEASLTETESMNKPEDGTRTAGENTTV